MYKRLLIIVIPIIIITLLLIKTDDTMAVHFIDVGQGDSIFIDFGDYEVLTDAGGNSSDINVADYIEPFVEGDLETVIATHIHEDHIGGLDEVIKKYRVNKIIDSGEKGNTIVFKKYCKAVENETNADYLSDRDMVIDLGGGAALRIIETVDDKSNTNDNSVIVMIDYNQIEVLLTGDMEESVEYENLNKFIDVEVLKAGHHGSKTASSMKFLNVTKPETVIISCGAENRYKHPHKETVSRFLAINAEVYGTFKSDTIILTTDGKTYTLNTSEMLTLSDAN